MTDARPMINAYPDSVGGTLAGLATFLERPELAGIFTDAYVLPSLYHSDLDRGFSVIDYDLEESLASRADLDRLDAAGIGLKLDFILNHCSAQSPQFRSLVADGDASPYRDFFIDWNEFWAGLGELTPEGYIQPRADLIEGMFFRKPGLPILQVRFPDGRMVPFWNTFYQEVTEDGRYLGQMDVNIRSEKVWEFYADTLATLAGYGARVVRLDAFAYASKEPGRPNFLNDPETWDVLERVRELADRHGISLLPEIHATYATGTHERIAEAGYLTYDFFLPGLLIDALETGSASGLARWAAEVRDKKLRLVTMLGCHDGIPVLDLEGLVPAKRIGAVIDAVVGRGGHVKNLHGSKATYYQVNATYFSALGESERAMLLARAIHLFMPGKPQVWYLDLLAGTNDYEALARAGANGHKEINRTNVSLDDAVGRLGWSVVRGQLDLLRFRSESQAFGWDADLRVEAPEPGRLVLEWTHDGATARLDADLRTCAFTVYDGESVVFAQE